MDLSELRELLFKARHHQQRQLLKILEDHQAKIAEIDWAILKTFHLEDWCKAMEEQTQEFNERCAQALEAIKDSI